MLLKNRTDKWVIWLIISYSNKKEAKQCSWIEKVPVERTPGTSERWGMSVGMDWTSHALHSSSLIMLAEEGDDKANKKTPIEIEITTNVFIFFTINIIPTTTNWILSSGLISESKDAIEKLEF